MVMDMALCLDLDDGSGPTPTPTAGTSRSLVQREEDDEDEDEEARSPCDRDSGTGSDGDVSDASDDGDHAAIVTTVRPSAAASTVVAFPLFTFSRTEAQTQRQAGAVEAATDPDAPELAAVHDPRRVKVNKKRKPPSTDMQASVQGSSGAPKKKKNSGRRERNDKLTPEKQATTMLCKVNFIFPSTTVVGSLQCTLCSSTFTCDTYSIRRHVTNPTHLKSMREKAKELSNSKKTSQQITDFFARPDHEHIQGASLAPDIQTFRCLCLPPSLPCYILTRVLVCCVLRVDVVRALLTAGIPLAGAQGLAPLLNKYTSFRVPSDSNMRNWIPVVHKAEVCEMGKEVEKEALCIAFDGTTRLGEMIAVSARWCDSDFDLRHRAMCIHTLAKSPKAVALANHLSGCISKRASDANIMGFVRDSVSVNGSALEKVKGSYITACDILCFSHTLNNTGDHMSFPRVSHFMGAWLQLSNAANRIWKDLTGQSIGGYSETRWWSKVRLTIHMRMYPLVRLAHAELTSFLPLGWLVCARVGGVG